MKGSSIAALTGVLAFTLLSGALPGAPRKRKAGSTAPAGQRIFLKKNCNKCHPVSSASIVATGKKAKRKGSDLARLDKRGTTFAARTTSYLKGRDKRGGKPHVVSFKGSDEELQAIVDWLGSLEVRK